jgi:hypothetical protein
MKRTVAVTFAGLVAAIALVLSEARAADALLAGFQDPPASARPRVWWHWMNGNVTKDGIAKDLAWLKSAGIGGVQNFDVSLQTPQIVEHRLIYMQPDWQDAFRFAVVQADRLGLEFAIASSPGWSETGGPWVRPEDGLKKLVWSETRVTGGRRFDGRLATPPEVTGPFQDLPFVDELGALGGGLRTPPPQHYADVRVLAVPASREAIDEQPMATTADGTRLDAAILGDGRYATAVALTRGTAASPASVRLVYPSAREIRTATFYMRGGMPLFGDAEYRPVLEALVGGSWQRIAALPVAAMPTTVSFPAVRATEFRLLLLLPDSGSGRAASGGPPPGYGAPGVAPFDLPGVAPAQPPTIAELRLGDEPRIDRFEAKAGYTLARDYYALGDAGGEVPGVPLSQVIDLTSRLRADGSLDWTPPRGEWRVLRLGYSLLGITNHPAPPEATGLEVDKFDGPAVRRYTEAYLKLYRDTTGDSLIGRRGLSALLTDSIEVGAANWTPQLIEKFKVLRGYDPVPWFPTLTGTIVESRARSDAFLYDFRRTLADLLSSEHYGTIAAVAHAQGLTVYGEALEDGRPSLGDDMAMREYADIPMAALWAWNRGSRPKQTHLGDMKGASSVAHVLGKAYVAAESMTSLASPWAWAPSDLRRIVDLEFAYGINRPVIHTSVHQPVDDKQPGLSLFVFGQYFTRHETWAGMARPWIDYIARSSYLLQQGRDVADVAYFYGEEQPLSALHVPGPPADLPRRYAYDFVNADILMGHLLVKDGVLVSSGGARYQALYLGGTSGRMTLPVLQKIAALVEAGATVIGPAPRMSPALHDDAMAFEALVRRLWSGASTTAIGAGRVIAGTDVDELLAVAGLMPDFRCTGAAASGEVLFVHRHAADADIYFVNNRRNAAVSVEARFRVANKRPEIWRADTGETRRATYRVENGEIVVPLEFEPEDSFFVVFRDPATEASWQAANSTWQPIATLDGAWDVAFEPGRGAPASTQLAALAPLNAQVQDGVRYFSGVATYTKSFALPKGLPPGTALQLDLGAVGDIAEVRVNGVLVGTAWHAPFRLDVGQATRPGKNTVEVRVANLWVNRLIGDLQPGQRKLAYTTLPTYRPDAPLRASGLIGPVRLLASRLPPGQ